jgi:two-component sensor histidine kinase
MGQPTLHDTSPEFIAMLNFLNAIGTGAVVIVILIFFSRTIYKKDEALLVANSELERQNKEIKDQHGHLQILLKEVHHRVKNNLQIISSLMSLQSRTVKDRETVAILNESRRRVEAIALIHQGLYQGDNANQVNFKSYLHELMSSQQTMYPHVSYSVESDEAILTLDTAVPLGLIISEMITNSIKHAFDKTNNPSISVQLNKRADDFELLVRDNGCGLSSDFDLLNPVSLGTEIIVSLVDQIDAKITNSNVQGAMFSITFSDDAITHSELMIPKI